MRPYRANVRESEVETLRSGSGRDTRGNDREADSTSVLLYGSYADSREIWTRGSGYGVCSGDLLRARDSASIIDWGA